MVTFLQLPQISSEMDSPIIYKLNFGWNFANRHSIFENSFLPIEICSKILKDVIESSHNKSKFFYWKTLKRNIFDKVNMWFYSYDVPKSWYDGIAPHMFTSSKMFRFKVFQYKISNRMSYLRALYDNFEIFNGKNFIGI